MSSFTPRFPLACMDCGEEFGFSEIEGSTGLCGVCPRSRERLGLDEEENVRDVDRSERARGGTRREDAEDYDPVAEDMDD